MIKFESGKFFQYETSGKFLTLDKWIHPARTLENYELILVLEGKVCIEEDGKQYELLPNNMIVLEPGKPHRGYAESIPQVSFYWMHFRTNMPLPFKLYDKNEYYDIKYLLKMLLHISNTPSYPKDGVQTLAAAIFHKLSYIGCVAQNSRQAIVKEIVEYVRINAANNVTVSSVARHFGYNVDYVGKLFKSSFGTGLKEYIDAEKIKLAKDLLLTSNLSIKEISARLGFSNENLFVKFYLYHENTSPTYFRNMYFNTHMNNK